MRTGWPSRGHEADGRRRARGLVAVVTALLLGALGAATLAAPDAKAEGENYVVATDTTFAPFEFQDAQGKFVDIDMDLAALQANQS